MRLTAVSKAILGGTIMAVAFVMGTTHGFAADEPKESAPGQPQHTAGTEETAETDVDWDPMIDACPGWLEETFIGSKYERLKTKAERRVVRRVNRCQRKALRAMRSAARNCQSQFRPYEGWSPRSGDDEREKNRRALTRLSSACPDQEDVFLNAYEECCEAIPGY